MRGATWARWAGLWLLVSLGACSDDDAVAGGDAGPDAGASTESDGGGFIRNRGDTAFGGPCKSDSDCDVGLSCDREVELSFDAEGLPPGTRSIIASRFPNGVCTPIAAAPYDPSAFSSCFPGAPRDEQGCGDTGECVGVSVADESLVACRPSCDPSAKQPCGGRFGYTCDFDSYACVEGCQSDEECRLVLQDSDGDGEADSLRYDDESEASCDVNTFRCVHDGSAGAATGDPCERLDDCDPEGLCLDPLQTFAGVPFPGGYCSKLGCDQPGRECDKDAVCERLRPIRGGFVTAPLCLDACKVGAEPEGERTGVNAHGVGCREGYACHYNGGSGNAGVCVGGNFNAISQNNVGGACETDADCYSPFGLGACMQLAVGDVSSPTGICSILDCGAPGLPEDICGAGNQCIGLDGDLTFCVQSCSKAEACTDHFACADDDGSPATDNVCFPACFSDADCRADEVCNFVAADAGYGACVASRP
jgi:hypothetical protein